MMRCAVSFPSIHRMGGIERVGLELANQIAGAGHHAIVVGYDIDASCLDARVEVRRIARPRGPRLRQSLRFPTLAERALHDSGERPEISFGLGALAPRGSVVWVTSVHARWLEVASRPPFDRSLKRRLNPFHPVMLRQERKQFATPFHAHLMGMARNVVDDLRRFYNVDPQHISEVPHGYDTTQFNTARADELRDIARERWAIGKDERVVLCVANEIDRKGLPQLMRAAAMIDGDKPRVLVAGRINPRRLKEVAEASGLGTDRLTHAGVVEDVAEALAACDAMVLPTFYDSWGLVIIEALACGKPVVTTRLAGASQVIDGRSNGIAIDHPEQLDTLRDAIAEVLAWDCRPQACARSVEHLKWENVIDRVLACGLEYSPSAHGRSGSAPTGVGGS